MGAREPSSSGSSSSTAEGLRARGCPGEPISFHGMVLRLWKREQGTGSTWGKHPGLYLYGGALGVVFAPRRMIYLVQSLVQRVPGGRGTWVPFTCVGGGRKRACVNRREKHSERERVRAPVIKAHARRDRGHGICGTLLIRGVLRVRARRSRVLPNGSATRTGVSLGVVRICVRFSTPRV